jgi:hypothetical protein
MTTLNKILLGAAAVALLTKKGRKAVGISGSKMSESELRQKFIDELIPTIAVQEANLGRVKIEPDAALRSEVWGEFLDNLYEEGQISEEMRDDATMTNLIEHSTAVASTAVVEPEDVDFNPNYKVNY